jgi:hypothetical protein
MYYLVYYNTRSLLLQCTIVGACTRPRCRHHPRVRAPSLTLPSTRMHSVATLPSACASPLADGDDSAGGVMGAAKTARVVGLGGPHRSGTLLDRAQVVAGAKEPPR